MNANFYYLWLEKPGANILAWQTPETNNFRIRIYFKDQIKIRSFKFYLKNCKS